MIYRILMINGCHMTVDTLRERSMSGIDFRHFLRSPHTLPPAPYFFALAPSFVLLACVFGNARYAGN